MDELLLANLILQIVKDIVAPKITDAINKHSIRNISIENVQEAI